MLSEPRWRARWSIGVYRGESPLELRPIADLSYPVLSANDVTDAPAAFVADPFLLREHGVWHLFFEVWNRASGRGEIGHARSDDGLAWTYGSVVLREPFHLSYPYVFRRDGAYFMTPESQDASSIRLYRALRFPDQWTLDAVLLEGAFVDPSPLWHDGSWWLFTHRGGLSGLEIYSADALHGPWEPHPASPLLEGDRRVVRAGGRMGTFDGRLLRFTQDGIPSYGYRVRAMEIDRLSSTMYVEHEVPQSPILQASRCGWNAIAMHHVDPHPADSGGWLAAVDGAELAFCWLAYRPGGFVTGTSEKNGPVTDTASESLVLLLPDVTGPEGSDPEPSRLRRPGGRMTAVSVLQMELILGPTLHAIGQHPMPQIRTPCRKATSAAEWAHDGSHDDPGPGAPPPRVRHR